MNIKEAPKILGGGMGLIALIYYLCGKGDDFTFVVGMLLVWGYIYSQKS